MCVCMKLTWNIAFLTMEHQESENYMWWCKDTCVHEWQVTQSNKIILRSTLLTFKKGNWCETMCGVGEVLTAGPKVSGTGLIKGTCRCLSPQPF
jgi:hypothetical protein